MNLLQAAILGLIQGLTEFLPVSSSGHLFLLEKYLNINDESLSFEIALHLATLLAVIIFFWQKIKKISIKTLSFLILATLPLIPVVLLSKNYLTAFSQSNTAIGLALLLSALVNWFSFRQLQQTNKNKKELTDVKDGKTALKIGFFQSLAIFPGVSRSGMTLFAALSSQVKTTKAFEFTFLLSIPAIVGAALFDLINSNGQALLIINWKPTLVAMFIAFISGFFSLKLLKNIITHNRFLYFAVYCLLLGIFQLIV